MLYMSYDEQTGKIIGFFNDEIPQHVSNNINEKSIKIDSSLIKTINANPGEYIVNLDTINNFNKDNILVDTDFNNYFKELQTIKIISDKIDPEKLALAEAIADLYERIVNLEGGTV